MACLACHDDKVTEHAAESCYHECRGAALSMLQNHVTMNAAELQRVADSTLGPVRSISGGGDQLPLTALATPSNLRRRFTSRLPYTSPFPLLCFAHSFYSMPSERVTLYDSSIGPLLYIEHLSLKALKTLRQDSCAVD